MQKRFFFLGGYSGGSALFRATPLIFKHQVESRANIVSMRFKIEKTRSLYRYHQGDRNKKKRKNIEESKNAGGATQANNGKSA